jgi:fructose-1,6-bisphosphatase/inositol monophosphatase family enzyme
VDLERLRDVALRAARAGDAVVRDWTTRGNALGTQRKGFGDYVTAADRAAEQAILQVLRTEAPDIAILAEESGGATSSDQPFWAVDPIDGTTNFLRGFPVVGISVGLMHRGRPVAGAITAPLIGQAWCAAQGLGASDGEGRPLHVRDDEQGRGVVAEAAVAPRTAGAALRRTAARPRAEAAVQAARQSRCRLADLCCPKAARWVPASDPGGPVGERRLPVTRLRLSALKPVCLQARQAFARLSTRGSRRLPALPRPYQPGGGSLRFSRRTKSSARAMASQRRLKKSWQITRRSGSATTVTAH